MADTKSPGLGKKVFQSPCHIFFIFSKASKVLRLKYEIKYNLQFKLLNES